MGIVFTTFFALGLMLISKIVSSVDLTHVLFGEVLGISNESTVHHQHTGGHLQLLLSFDVSLWFLF